MNTEQERADFEAWHTEQYFRPIFDDEMGRFIPMAVQYRYEAYQAGRAALQSQDRRDAARYRYLIAKLQQAYDGDYFETDLISLYCLMPSQYKGERVVRAEITWRDKADEPIGLSEAIDHARRIEGERNARSMD